MTNNPCSQTWRQGGLQVAHLFQPTGHVYTRWAGTNDTNPVLATCVVASGKLLQCSPFQLYRNLYTMEILMIWIRFCPEISSKKNLSLETSLSSVLL